jgi:protease IV
MSDQIPTDSADKARPKSIGDTGDNWERAALERIALAAINEQRAARRWRIFFRFVFLAILAIAVWSAFDFTSDKVAKTSRHTGRRDLRQ